MKIKLHRRQSLSFFWDDFYCDVKSFMTFITVTTVTWNKSVGLIWHFLMRESYA